MNSRHKAIVDIFTKLEKKELEIWFPGKDDDGEYRSWYENGQIENHAFYKNGMPGGERKVWHNNGQIWEHSFYKNGNLNGEYKRWYDNGKIEEHSFYRNGIKAKTSKNIKKGYIYADGKYWKD